ncbi:hypothetical protein IV498_15865 [Paenarthrobacter sp. Z7-10]|uniref:hypothetical protein n=1 Tax=Paenarthrobacter sp. Z7-10 TaxID=2787635 RepID=UPI0022A95703|nr:hypothetical protein [Paenarthrobacter sp. Z7-10]MCZ2404614.1 hypothetical protein [Paenarthrobacter sp. Z7-10]
MKDLKKKALTGLALAALFGAGALSAVALPASAAGTTTVSPSAAASSDPGASGSGSASDPAPSAPDSAPDPSKGGHRNNGVTEVLLTGSTAAKVKAAVLAAEPGATFQRLENDAEGATYEAHILTSAGTAATVKLDASFRVTATETGGPADGHRGTPGSNG